MFFANSNIIMQFLGYIIIILLSGLIGFITITVVIKLLFKPLKPVKLLGLTIQGILPRYQPDIINGIAKMAAKEFDSFNIEEKIANPQVFEKIKPEIEEHIDDFLRNKLKVVFPILGNFIGDKTINQLKQAFLNELETMFPTLMKSYAAKLKDDINVERLITTRLNLYSSENIEAIIYKNAGGKIKMMQAAAYMFGCIIGLIQVLIAISIAK